MQNAATQDIDKLMHFLPQVLKVRRTQSESARQEESFYNPHNTIPFSSILPISIKSPHIYLCEVIKHYDYPTHQTEGYVVNKSD